MTELIESGALTISDIKSAGYEINDQLSLIAPSFSKVWKALEREQGRTLSDIEVIEEITEFVEELNFKCNLLILDYYSGCLAYEDNTGRYPDTFKESDFANLSDNVNKYGADSIKVHCTLSVLHYVGDKVREKEFREVSEACENIKGFRFSGLKPWIVKGYTIEDTFEATLERI